MPGWTEVDETVNTKKILLNPIVSTYYQLLLSVVVVGVLEVFSVVLVVVIEVDDVRDGVDIAKINM